MPSKERKRNNGVGHVLLVKATRQDAADCSCRVAGDGLSQSRSSVQATGCTATRRPWTGVLDPGDLC
jgi:hypothetical protein